MSNNTAFQNVLGVFTHYGFRKTSMADLAEAADVSRQTLYNKFKTKEAVLDWALQGFVSFKKEEAIAELQVQGRTVEDALIQAFARWVGDSVPMLHNAPHGFEIMDLAAESFARTKVEPHAEFEVALSSYFMEQNICASPEEASDKVFLLMMASKGLMIKITTTEEFNAGMIRIIKAADITTAS